MEIFKANQLHSIDILLIGYMLDTIDVSQGFDANGQLL